MSQTPTKFTQEIKDNWLAALKSGKYKQGFTQLYNPEDNSFCCLGVLKEECLKQLSLDPYEFLDTTIGAELENGLWRKNDERDEDETYPRDYSNVIPLIEQLPVQE